MMVLISVACKNKKGDNETPGTLIETNPEYRNLNDSIRRFPADATLYMRRASRLAQENAHELAYQDFQKAWSLQPLLEIGLPLAANLEILGKHDEKLVLLETLNHNYPQNPQVKRLLADAYVASGKTKQALIIYNDMIAKDSLDPETLYEKAMLLQQLKDTVQAISTLQRAYAIQKVDTYGLELAHLYAEQKNHKALEICDFILTHDSVRILTDPFFIKGIYYANTKQYTIAIAQFDSCILRDWKTTDAYLEKGRVYFNMKNFNSAKQTFNMAITVSNSDPDAYYWLGRCYEEQHQKTDAINNYRKAIALDRDFIEAIQRLESLDRGFVHPSH
ncbi:MAG: tetratricopeptide repeat protein [Bacteroidota bacterium]|nr:tetratricopeptide repeat protein [Bacteroidota bacterium]